MASENAKAVAKEVIKRVRKGQKVKMGEIIENQGYSESVSKSPTKVSKTKSYQKEMKPVVNSLENIRNNLIIELENRKDLSGERMKELVEMLNKLNHDIQLLSGGATNRDEMIISKEDEKRIKEIFK